MKPRRAVSETPHAVALPVEVRTAPSQALELRRGTPLPLRKGLERLNRKYATTLEKLAK